MENVVKQISAVLPDEASLELMINRLLAEAVCRSDISVQGGPEQIYEKYGVSFIDPEILAHSNNPPTTEPFMNDDRGWVKGFSIAIPLFICIIIGVFIIGDIQSTHDNLLYGVLGAVIGATLGYLCLYGINKHHLKNSKNQEQQGGFILWVTTHTEAQYQEVKSILADKPSQPI